MERGRLVGYIDPVFDGSEFQLPDPENVTKSGSLQPDLNFQRVCNDMENGQNAEFR